MYLQWVDLEGVKIKSIFKSTTLKLPSNPRIMRNNDNRKAKLKCWQGKITSPGFTTAVDKVFNKSLKYRLDKNYDRLKKLAITYYSWYKLGMADRYCLKLLAYQANDVEITLLQQKILKRRKSVLYRILKKFSNKFNDTYITLLPNQIQGPFLFV